MEKQDVEINTGKRTAEVLDATVPHGKAQRTGAQQPTTMQTVVPTANNPLTHI
jgi:hypothetical protein